MILGFLPQDKPTLLLIALMLVALGVLSASHYLRRRRRSRRRQVFHEKLRQHQAATSAKEMSQE